MSSLNLNSSNSSATPGVKPHDRDDVAIKDNEPETPLPEYSDPDGTIAAICAEHVGPVCSSKSNQPVCNSQPSIRQPSRLHEGQNHTRADSQASPVDSSQSSKKSRCQKHMGAHNSRCHKKEVAQNSRCHTNMIAQHSRNLMLLIAQSSPPLRLLKAHRWVP